jgi:serine/threonine protein kinase/TPR repeat protein
VEQWFRRKIHKRERMKTCPQCDTGYPDSQTACPIHGHLLNEIRELKPGMVIHKTYRIVRKLGQGGMGTVYLAQHIHMGEPRALKFLSPELSRDQALTSRFLREVRTLRQIRNRNVVDCGDLEAAEDDSLFFSMEFVDGPDLRGLMHNTTGPFPVPLVLSIARQIAEGLGAAHSKGMVHRDIKPENILMARDGDAWLPKIADFGIVATKESSTAYTRTGGTLLTMAYAAPEQWRGTPAASLDGRTDLYALGGLLYEMLTGQTPFHAENYEGWARQHQTTPPQPPSIHRPDLANWCGLDALVLRLLAKDRNDRPKDVAELLGLIDAVRLVPPDVRQKTVEEYAGKRADKKSNRRLPRWVWITSVSVVGWAIVIAGLAFSLPASTISKRANELDDARHYNLGGILRNLACTRGNGESCRRLGAMYFFGPELGVAKDEIQGAKFFSKACDAGDANGCAALGMVYEGGSGVSKDYLHAATLYSKACDAGDSAGCAWLGDMYYAGRAVAQDYPRAAALYTKACDAGNANGCSWLGSMYTTGRGVSEDGSRAAEFFTKACYGGVSSSCMALAENYEFGWGVGKDIREAAMLYKKACTMGYEDSCSKAEKLH